MLGMVKKTLKGLKGKKAARIFAAVIAASLLFGSSLGVSFAAEEEEENIYIENEPSTGGEPSGAGEQEPLEEDEQEPSGAGEQEPSEEDEQEPLGGDGQEPSEEDVFSMMAFSIGDPLPEEEPQSIESGITGESALRTAITDAAAGDTITLGGSITLDATLTINKNLTLDLNGYTLSLADSATGSVIKVTGSGVTFTLQDSAEGGKITKGKAVDGGGVYCEGKFIMSSGIIDGNTASGSGGGVYCKGDFEMTNGGTISNNTAVNGGGVYCLQKVTITNGTISNNTATGSGSGNGTGGGVNCGGDFEMITGTLSNNTAYIGGGVCGSSKVTIKNGTISNNTATDHGGGVNGLHDVSIENGTISHNKALGSDIGGGGVNCDGNFEMKNGTISNNEATGSGGGVSCQGFTLTENGTISENRTAGSGGGVNCITNFNMTNGTISGNTAAVSGGGVSCKVTDFNMNGGKITRNTAVSGGGGSDIHCVATGDILIGTSPDSSWGLVDGREINGWYYDGGNNYDVEGTPIAERWSAGGAQIFNKSGTGFRLPSSNDKPLALRAAHRTIPTPTPPAPAPAPAPRHEHNYKQTRIPTCTTDGEEKCECGDARMFPPLGHSYNEGIVTKEADCGAAGVKTFTCTRCNDSKTEEIPALAHRWDNGTVTKAATQTEEGVRTYTCRNNAAHTRTEAIAKLEAQEDDAQTEQTGRTEPTTVTNTAGTENPVHTQQQTQTAQAAETAPVQTAEIIPDAGYEYPAYRNETPDPNDPASPEIIVMIDENGTPLTYRKVEDPDNPGQMIYMEDSSIPLSASAATGKTGQWALLNLIMTLMSVLGGVYALIGYIAGRKREEKEEKQRRWYLIGAGMALLSVIVFVLTEDVRMTMTLTDRYTFLTVALALMQTPGFLQRRKREELA